MRKPTTCKACTPYERALNAFEAGQVDGIGFCLFGTEFAAFDIDHCRDPQTGLIVPVGKEIVDRAASYTEITVSGTGLRVIGLAPAVRSIASKRLPTALKSRLTAPAESDTLS